MKLAEITPRLIRSALEIYMREAYPRSVPARVRIPGDVIESEDVDVVLKAMLNETRTCGGMPVRRYALRLGNERYPFMKLALEEYLLADEFVFVADTHDEMDVKPNYPDYEQWMNIKEFNARLRERIEAAWRAEGIDTCARLRARAEGLAARRMCRMRGQKALVVDDQTDLAETFAAVLRADGFEVMTALDGRQGFELAKSFQPDLVVTDYEMQGMNGLQLIETMRSEPKTKEIPVILATGCLMSIEQIAKATAYLAKPFAADVLVELCDHLVQRPASTAADAIA